MIRMKTNSTDSASLKLSCFSLQQTAEDHSLMFIHEMSHMFADVILSIECLLRNLPSAPSG